MTSFRICIRGEAAIDIHRIRNMAEELHFEMTRLGYGRTSDPDIMTTEMTVAVKHRRDVGDATKLFRAILRKHMMEDDVEVERL